MTGKLLILRRRRCAAALFGVSAAATAALPLPGRDDDGFAVLHHSAQRTLIGPIADGGDGYLYGVAGAISTDNGAIYRFRLADGQMQTLAPLSYTNAAAGTYPAGLLLAADQRVYFTASRGGNAGEDGTLVRVARDGSDFAIVHTFDGSGGNGRVPSESPSQGLDGAIYGSTLATGPIGSPPVVGGGTLWRVNPDGSDFRTIVTFRRGGADGYYPNALVPGRDGRLYGTASGDYSETNTGVVFRVEADGSGYTLLHRFVPGDGVMPYAPPIQSRSGTLFGTTFGGGPRGAGTVYRIEPDGSGYRQLHAFTGSDGSFPSATVTEGRDGYLYGLTSIVNPFAGPIVRPGGTVFRVAPDGSHFRVLHTLNARTDGYEGQQALVETGDGVFHGVTRYGGTHDLGTIFRMLAPPVIRFGSGNAAPSDDGGSATVVRGQSLRLHWDAIHADACTASGAWRGSRATRGSETITPALPGQYRYTLTCDGPGAPTTETFTLKVKARA